MPPEAHLTAKVAHSSLIRLFSASPRDPPIFATVCCVNSHFFPRNPSRQVSGVYSRRGSFSWLVWDKTVVEKVAVVGCDSPKLLFRTDEAWLLSRACVMHMHPLTRTKWCTQILVWWKVRVLNKVWTMAFILAPHRSVYLFSDKTKYAQILSNGVSVTAANNFSYRVIANYTQMRHVMWKQSSISITLTSK